MTIRGALFGLAVSLSTFLSQTASVVAAPPQEPIQIDEQATQPPDFSLADSDILYSDADAKVVGIAANLLADDIQRVTDHRPTVKTDIKSLKETAVILATRGVSPEIDKLVPTDDLWMFGLTKENRESFTIKLVDNPFPNVKCALVIVGTDRRGTAYGAMAISQQIGVSPWYWWADLPPAKKKFLHVTGEQTTSYPPQVKYRGIFINDEDFGFRPWALKIDDANGTKRIGPKAYAHVFELMLRLRLNYIWPGMHPGSGEFTAVPGNAELADDWAIVTGASHCEPMLRNNVYWPKENGEWRYDTNTKTIHDYWEWAAKNRGPFEAVWTLGIRGIHDEAMKGPKEIPARVKMVEDIFADQQKLIADNVTKKYGPPAQCFVPYKEVLPLYEAGLKVPENVTIVWPDDNFGYIRRLASDAERKRVGGTGVYYHLSYWGSPHSYLWVQSTSPALVWEEMHKAYENGSKELWVVNVGDIKPGEILLDFWSQLAWSPDAFGPDAQTTFLNRYCTDTFGKDAGPKVKALLDQYFRVAAMRRPEHLSYVNVPSMRQGLRQTMLNAYAELAEQEKAVAAVIPADRQDNYFQTVGYGVRALCNAGNLFLGDEADQPKWKKQIDDDTAAYNQSGQGKWDRMMALNANGMRWPEAVGGKMKAWPTTKPGTDDTRPAIDAAAGRKTDGGRSWKVVDGLGWTGRAVTPLPTTAVPDNAPPATLAYDFDLPADVEGAIGIDALPTMRLTSTDRLRIGVSIDNGPMQAIDIPGGDATSENSPARSQAVVMNRKSFDVPLPPLKAGRHTLTISAIDAGVVLDQIRLPMGAKLAKN